MKLTDTMRRVLYAFRRTGTASRGEIRRETIRYAPALKSLMKRGFVQELKDGEYALTQAGGTLMPEVLEDDKCL